MKKKNLEIQSMMRKTLKEEKTERLKFFNSVKNQIEKVDERVSQFMNTTDASLNEQIRKSESGLKEIRNEVSDIRESIDKEVSAVDKGIVDDVIAMVKKSTTDLTKFQGQLKEHLKTSDSRFGTVAQIIGACPGGKWQRYGEKCFQFYTDSRITWFEARDTCRSIGGELARIGNKRENNFIKNTIKRSYPVSYWFGLHDTQSENFWQWSSSNGTYSLGKFSNWAPDEPNNAFGNEDCSVIWGNGEWNDIDCSLKMTFICETFLF
ncbi:hepatic lectin-like [Ruditapes philippinarum]|uniref:hepatic lectin-like n=1 Tax=Ruditapes philippinarum TaxID=129788 RepID=UPI00295B1EC8|nr:hepatic lectin-like [Ruditapes philippinarum]